MHADLIPISGEPGAYEIIWRDRAGRSSVLPFAAYVYPDNGGYRPYGRYGKCLTSGRRPHPTPQAAAHWSP